MLNAVILPAKSGSLESRNKQIPAHPSWFSRPEISILPIPAEICWMRDRRSRDLKFSGVSPDFRDRRSRDQHTPADFGWFCEIGDLESKFPGVSPDFRDRRSRDLKFPAFRRIFEIVDLDFDLSSRNLLDLRDRRSRDF